MTVSISDMNGFVERLSKSARETDLFDQLLEMTGRLGFTYFALTEHVNVEPGDDVGISLVNYPKDWEGMFRRKRLFGVDPVHRAAQVRAMPFCWSEVSRIIPMTAQDLHVFELARENGLGDGYTIPACIPGRTIGSCSFGMARDEVLSLDQLPLVAFVGQAAYEAASSLVRRRFRTGDVRPLLTDRQLDCVALVAQGLTTLEISKALGVKYETAVQHIKDAADRYGVTRRSALPIRALLDGSLCFSDMLPRTSAILKISDAR